jgi:arsenite methyltransferase
MRFDERASRRVLASYRTPDIVGQRRRVRAAIGAGPGERILDIGSGPGLLAGELARAVGPTGAIVGIDLSADMLALAAELGGGALGGESEAPVAFQLADATELPFADASFDGVVSTQVYEYVEDVPRALAEARRVLAPNGRIVILDTDWDSLVWQSGDGALTRRVLTAWDQHLADPFLPRRLPRLLRESGFILEDTDVFALVNVGYDRDTFSAGLIEMVAAFVPDHGGITETDARAWADQMHALGPDYFFTLNRYLFSARRST